MYRVLDCARLLGLVIWSWRGNSWNLFLVSVELSCIKTVKCRCIHSWTYTYPYVHICMHIHAKSSTWHWWLEGKMQTWAYTRDPETRMAETKLVRYSCRCFVACASQRPVDPLLWGSVGHLIEMRFTILAHPSWRRRSLVDPKYHTIKPSSFSLLAQVILRPRRTTSMRV